MIGFPITGDWISNHLPPIDVSINHNTDSDVIEGLDVCRSLQLLTDAEVGFSQTDAKNLMVSEDGRRHRFEWLERQVFMWVRQERQLWHGWFTSSHSKPLVRIHH